LQYLLLKYFFCIVNGIILLIWRKPFVRSRPGPVSSSNARNQ